MRIIILTSTRAGTASYFLPHLIGKTGFEISAVIYCSGSAGNNKNKYKKIVRKTLRIGLLGALNGLRMRKWYGEDLRKYIELDDIELLCSSLGIPFIKVGLINSSETINHFKSLEPDLALSLGNSYIGSKVFTIPKFGMINVHGEILPDYKNAQSVIWQIYNGSKYTGYTIHEINKGIDTGKILKQEKFPIIFHNRLHETVSSTCAEILRKAAIGMVEVLNNFPDFKKNAYEQTGGKKYTTPGIFQFIKIVNNHKMLKNNNHG